MTALGPQDQVLDTLPDGVVVADTDGHVVQLNARAVAMFAGGAVGDRLRDVVRLRDQEGRDWYSCNQPYGGLSTRSGIPEQSWFLPCGEEVLVATSINREGPGHRVSSVALTVRSGRGRARLDRDRSDLVATVAHELRSPLTGVRGFVQAMLSRWDKLTDEQKKLMLTTVNADADRLGRLITELLDVARIDTGRLSLYPRPCDPAVLSERIVSSVGVGTSRPVELDVAEDLPEVFADPDKFTQVLTNLVENGLRHGAGRVEVSLTPVAPDDDVHPGVLLQVDDEGEGIPQEIRRRVFTRFWTHGVRGGSGLGMYIANGLTGAHGGRVEIGDAPSGGARVRVFWPTEDRRPTPPRPGTASGEQGSTS